MGPTASSMENSEGKAKGILLAGKELIQKGWSKISSFLPKTFDAAVGTGYNMLTKMPAEIGHDAAASVRHLITARFGNGIENT